MDVDGEVTAAVARFGASPELSEEIRGIVRRALVSREGPDATVLLPDPEAPSPLPSTTSESTDAALPRAPAGTLPERYEDLGVLGEGGMGRVHRVRDRVLGRVAALKVVAGPLVASAEATARFVEEAQVAAQLQHPGLVPVYDAGRLADGRSWFTMKEVRGRTLKSAIVEVHDASADGTWRAGRTGWTLHRLVDAFAKACDAVGYAHARGVLHRDLKPANVMLGDHGEVLVIDWGLAKIVGHAEREWTGEDPEEPVLPYAAGRREGTRLGTVKGTPAYMAPEQARGEVDRLDPRTDVYALGAILYAILAGRPPYGGPGTVVHRQVLSVPPPPLPQRVPEELRAVCERAMSRQMADRHANGSEVAAAARGWLEGARKRELALEVVARSHAAEVRAAELRTRAAELRAEGAALLAGARPWDSEERKAPGWAKEDEAEVCERDADLFELRAERLLHGALQHDPSLPEAHVALLDRARAVHARAEDERDEDRAARAEVPLREHADRLPEAHPVRSATARYFRGDGALTLVTDSDGAEVELHRYETRDRRLVPVPVRVLGRTPLVEVPLPMGSYLCVVRQPDRAPVRYPVAIGRGEHWHGVPPGGRGPFPVVLPRTEDLGPDDVYVPAGWFRAGDPRGMGNPWQRVWCDAVVVRRFPVTNAEYVAFLDDLVANGREAEALRCVPRERAGGADEDGAMIYGRDANGAFVLREDADGDRWDPEWPVFMVDWACAVAHAGWEAARSGRPWRLPRELEREKAARGVDGRTWPWGDRFDPSWSCMRDSHAGRALPSVVRGFPVDESVYGLRGCAGNVADWCEDRYDRSGPLVRDGRIVANPASEGGNPVIRGACWRSTTPGTRTGHRDRNAPRSRNQDVGFRLARSLP